MELNKNLERATMNYVEHCKNVCRNAEDEVYTKARMIMEELAIMVSGLSQLESEAYTCLYEEEDATVAWRLTAHEIIKAMPYLIEWVNLNYTIAEEIAEEKERSGSMHNHSKNAKE